MASISRAALFGKLNRIGYRAIESATVFCKMRGNPYVELVHWIHQILQLQDSDLHRIIRQFNLEPSRLAADITVRSPGIGGDQHTLLATDSLANLHRAFRYHPSIRLSGISMQAKSGYLWLQGLAPEAVS